VPVLLEHPRRSRQEPDETSAASKHRAEADNASRGSRLRRGAALLLAVLFVSPAEGVPRVDYIPADASCALDSPAVLRSQQDRE